MSLYLNELRKKPKHVRDNIAFGVAGGFTLLVAGIAFMTGSFMNISGMTEDKTDRPAIFSTLFGQLKEQTAGAFGAFKRDTQTEVAEVLEQPNLIDISGFQAVGTSTPEKEVSIVVVPTASTTEEDTASSAADVLY